MRRRVIGGGSVAGAVLAFGMSPWAAAPAANADIEDLIIEPVINSVGSFGSLVDPSAADSALALPADAAATASSSDR